MKSYQRFIIGSLSIAVLSASAIPVWAAEQEIINNDLPYEIQIQGAVPISAELDEEQKITYGSFTGTVKEITHSETVAGMTLYLVENQAGEQANIVVSESTYLVNDEEIKTGSVITGFYDVNAPMIMIYPPQYSCKVVALNSEEQNIKVDRFDQNLISSDNTLKLNISDQTEIMTQEGKPFDGELTDKNLVVIYGAATKSIPAQTTPEKIVLLFEKELPAEEEYDEELSITDLVVNSQVLKAPTPYQNQEGSVMVPLRAIAEALDLAVTWDEADQTVSVGESIEITIGEDKYTTTNEMTQQLGVAPELVENKTFVPLSFFKELVEMTNTYVSEGQVIIEHQEPLK